MGDLSPPPPMCSLQIGLEKAYKDLEFGRGNLTGVMIKNRIIINGQTVQLDATAFKSAFAKISRVPKRRS